MSGPGSARGDRIVTPAVIGAAGFVALAAVVAITFIGARGGLALPVAATPRLQVAAASPAASPQVAITAPPSAASAPASAPASTPASSPAATQVPSEPPSSPRSSPTPQASPTGPVDPLTALPGCPDHPGCYEYSVRIGDSYTEVNDRFGLQLWITDALNPEVVDHGVITVGQTLYLGRDPEARLDPCPDAAACRLYTTRLGDTLSRIAVRYGISVAGIEALNPSLDPNAFGPGAVLRLPLYQG